MIKLLVNNLTILGALILFVCGYFFLQDVTNHIDLSWYDEPFYQKNGILLFQNGWPDPNWGPLYSFWYRILYVFFDNPIDLNYANICILTIGVSVGGYLALRVWNVSFLVSFLFGYFLLLSDLNIYVFPKPVHLALGITWSGFICLRFAKDSATSFLILCLHMLAIAYVRPEFYLAFLLLMFAFLVQIIFNWFTKGWNNESRKSWAFIGIVCVVAIFFGWQMGWPFLSDLGHPERSFLAFTQHFAIHYFERNHIQLDPFFECGRLWSMYLPGVSSIGDCIRLYPTEFAMHIFSNIKLWFVQARLLFYHNSVLFPTTWPLVLEAIALMVSIGIYIGYSIVTFKRKLSKEKIRVVFLTMLMLGPSFISNFLVFPRSHYILYMTTVLAFLIVLIVSKEQQKEQNSKITLISILLR